MQKKHLNRDWNRGGRTRRQGSVLVYVALMLPVLLGISAMAVDMSYLYNQRALAQRAADAAALAGATYFVDATSYTSPHNAMQAIAAANGFDPTSNPRVTVTDSCPSVPCQNTCTRFNSCSTQYIKVTIDKNEPSFFSGILGITGNKVEATAIAEYSPFFATPISPQQYGLASSADYNYSLFGPYAFYSYGDDTATIYTDGTGGTVNGAVNGNYLPNGINYTITQPNLATYQSTYGTSNMVVQIFDPTTTNNGVDEIRDPNVTTGAYKGTTPQAWNGNDYTITQYTLDWDVDGNPNNPDAADHVQIGQAQYGNQPQYAGQWVTPSGSPLTSGSFTVDLSQYTTGNFHVNVQALNGSSENGFSLRAGPPAGDNTSMIDESDTTWNAKFGNNGTTVEADGILPVNFNVNGTASIELGVFGKPNLATGATNAGTITIKKFDTDVGANNITYQLVDPTTKAVLATYDSSYTFQGSTVQLNTGNGVFSTDTIVLPTSFPGGVFEVNYSAGAADTSEWQLGYSGNLVGKGTISLIQ